MPNAVTRQYLAECSDPPFGLRRVARDLTLPAVYGQSYGTAQLDRPMIATSAELTAFGADLGALLDTLTSLPDRLCGGDLRKYCSVLNMDDRLAELVCRDADRPLVTYARADAYHDGSGLRLLELNVGSELGGLDNAQLNRAFLDVPAFADFAGRHGLYYVDTLSRVASALRTAASAVTSGDPVVALVESNGCLDAHRHVFVSVQEAMAGVGIDLMLGELHELGERDGKVVLRGTPVDVILRHFVAGEIVDDPAGRESLDLVLGAPGTVLFTALKAAAFASKGSLGLLHDPQVRELLSETERARVDRVVPWTRVLAGADAELIERCRDERADLVLKPGIGYSGVGTLVGHETSDEQWHRALTERVATDHVVQRRVRPVTEPVTDADTGDVHEWVVNWGLFVDADGYAGGFVRALRPEHGAVISYSNGETRGTCIFSTP